MDNLLDQSDEELRDRVRKGFEDSKKSKKIEERPKTPRNISAKNKKKKVTILPKTDIKSFVDQNLSSIKREQKTQTKEEPKTQKKELKENITKKNKLVKNIKSHTKQNINTVYLCPNCNKTYKSKTGILKHMAICKA
mgnify:CR=1 FL=1